MKIRLLFILILILNFSSISDVNSEISNKSVLNEVFLGCVNEDLGELASVGGQYEYCGCFVNKISKNLNIEDLMSVGIEVMKNSGNENAAIGALLENDIVAESIISCASSLFK
ncbi:MAG: hypothetical protein VW265_02410 [Hyphomicrobiales bacterium]